ncbi:pleckstrin homology domain-containing family M member 1-like isoform X1 [Macrobrachium nipponense]|uniref:pleckstrin homology domain-containing family M member 1-like isoform X1 n=1 Tax=Macrobrachium nipponense TaxID=159736 RepID=UPI0030C7E25E
MFSQKIKREKREAAISASLIARLQEAVQSVLQPGSRGEFSDARSSPASLNRSLLGLSDNTNALCNVLEAIFIHGLRDSLGERMSSLLGSDPDRMPVPNFWPVIMVISHRDFMEQVSELSFITSEVGRSRAWVRLALNQGQVCSYLSVLLQDNRTLKDYYRTTAFLRDTERSDIMLRVLQPISTLTFNLATNAAVLNTWTQTPLVLAGLWAPSTQSVVADPVLAATDVASTVYDQPTVGVAIPVVETPICDEMFNMIIGGTPETSFIKDSVERQSSVEVKDNKKSTKHDQKDVNSSDNKFVNKEDGNIPSPTCENVESPDIQEISALTESAEHAQTELAKTDEDQESSVENSVADSYRRGWSVDSAQSLYQSGPAFAKIISELDTNNPFSYLCNDTTESNQTVLSSDSTPSQESSRSDEAEKLNYEVVPQQPVSKEDMDRLLPLLTRLTTEEGLDSQVYQCYECKSYIGMIYGKPRVCNFDKRYYCYECHEDEVAIIPARLVHNWDLSTYPVCKKNSQWLTAIHHQPLIDLRTVNPKLYCHVDDLAEMQMLRTQLLYVRAYLFTCRSDAGDQLRKMLWPRDHMYEHVHLYSVSDMCLLGQGQLVSRVRQAVTFGREHVHQCEVCSPRGFLCELCSEKDVIYPFQLGTTYTCGDCYGVYHAICARGQKECRRCLRRQARKESVEVQNTEEV